MYQERGVRCIRNNGFAIQLILIMKVYTYINMDCSRADRDTCNKLASRQSAEKESGHWLKGTNRLYC